MKVTACGLGSYPGSVKERIGACEARKGGWWECLLLLRRIRHYPTSTYGLVTGCMHMQAGEEDRCHHDPRCSVRVALEESVSLQQVPVMRLVMLTLAQVRSLRREL